MYKGIVIGNISVCKFMLMLSFISVHVEFSRMYLTFYKLLLNIAVACMCVCVCLKIKTNVLLIIRLPFVTDSVCKALI